MSRRVLPYRIPTPDCINAEGWILLTDAAEVPLPDALPDWDYQMDLHIRRRVHVDLRRIRHEARIHSTAALNLVVIWTASGSNLRAPADRVPVDGSDSQAVAVSARLSGARLGGRLTLETALVLAEPVVNRNAFTVHLPGSVLWSDRHVVRLQGDAPQFPMALIDFSKTSFPDGAGWHLQIGGSLHAATMGSLLLLVNERKPPMAAAFKNAGHPQPADRVVLSTVYADVARTMIEHALRNPDFTDESQFQDGTLGATLASLFHRLFPGRSVLDIRLRLEESPSLFASELQAAVRIFEEV